MTRTSLIWALSSDGVPVTPHEVNLVAFYFGNLTHPSVGPPRVGFLSTVPANADELLTQAVQDGQDNGNTFEQTLVVAPTASAAATHCDAGGRFHCKDNDWISVLYSFEFVA